MKRNVLNEVNHDLAAATLSCIGDGVVSTDLSGKIIYMNHIAEEIIEMPLEEVLGYEFGEVFSFINLDTNNTLRNPITKVLEQDSTTGLEKNTIIVTKNNVRKYISATCSPIKAVDYSTIGVVVILRDITRLKTLEMQHLTQENNLKRIFNYAPVGMISLDEEGLIYQANDAVLQFTDQNREQVLGKYFGEAFNCIEYANNNAECGYGKCSNCIVEETITLAIEHRKASSNLEVCKTFIKNGMPKDYWFRLSAVPILVDEKYHAVITLMDITENKYKEISVAKSKEEAEAANKAKSEFLANMSHEIRTPINGVVGMVDLALLTQLNEEQKDLLITAKACANSLLNIINDILDFSKMEAGKLSIEYVNFNIKEMIQEVIRMHSPRVAEKGLELNYTLASSIPEFLVGDPNRIRQIINNLISNAIKFTETGKISVTVKRIATHNNEVELKFTVEDTGIGIASDDIGRLFQSFSQIEDTFTKKYGGTGLGLAISKKLVELMGGTIYVNSTKDKGSSFHFHLRFKEGVIIKKETKIFPQIKKITTSHKILLVDDDAINIKVIHKMLMEKGYQVMAATNGLEAISLFQKESYDIILMDIQMPGIDGLETARRIKKLEKAGEYTPIVALTAYALQGDKERFISLGMDAYIPMPIQMYEMFYVIDQIIQMKSNHVNSTVNNDIYHKGFSSLYGPEQNSNMTYNIIELINDIDEDIKIIESAAECNNLLVIERIAHEIKRKANDIDATDMKDSAFKIELAARRGNLIDASKNLESLKTYIKIYQGTREL